MLAHFIYNLFIFFLGNVIRLASLFNPKAGKWITGRANWRQTLRQSVTSSFRPGKKVVWLHAASLGEFEQGKPVLEGIRQQYPEINILVSFFSPSGYEVSGKYPHTDAICYLPTDTAKNAHDFLDIVNPSLVLWMKYEYWWNTLGALSERKIPVLLISAIFQERQPFFKFYGSWFRKKLGCFTHIFVQTSDSFNLITPFLSKDIVTISGDTRFDRVMAIAANWKSIPIIDQWLEDGKKVWVAGSTWHDDEKILMHLIENRKEVKWIIAPHKTDPSSLSETFNRFPNALHFSKLKENGAGDKEKNNHILVIDGIGVLSRLYRYGTICYIGGGFNDSGIHNTLEAAVYGKPVIFGPSYEKFAEAVGLVDSGAALSFENVIELEGKLIPLLENPEKIKTMGMEAAQFVSSHAGATAKILDYIYKNRLLTN